MRRILLALALCTPVALLTGCPSPTTQSPAPVKPSLDLAIARALLDAQTAIEKAKGLVAGNPALKDPLNRVIAGYNAALDLYGVYHSAVVAGGNPDPSAIQAQIAQLTSAVLQIQGMFQ